MPTAITIGAICGILGALFVAANTYVNMFRKVYFNSSAGRIFEVTLIAIVTTAFAFWLPYWIQSECVPVGNSTDNSLVQYNCPNTYFNPLATLTMNTEGLVVKNIVTGFGGIWYDNGVIMNSTKIGIFGLYWFVFSCLTYGSSVPSGPFLSAILVGCSVG